MVDSVGTRGANVVKRRHPRIRQAWLRFGVWIFIFVFAFSIVGGMMAAGFLK